jgi:predicted ATP-dependent serine protease
MKGASMLVGRERDRAELSQVLAGIGPSTGAGIFLRGQAGIGKSTLLRALREQAVSGGAVVASVAGIEGRWASQFAALKDELAPPQCPGPLTGCSNHSY